MNSIHVLRREPFLITAFACFVSPACADRSDDPGESVIAEVSLADTLSVIGDADSLSGHALYRVSGAFRSAGDRLYVADGGSSEIRVFNDNSRLEAAWGRKGRGPGEHQALAWITPAADDTVLTYDGILRKVVYWSLSGVPAREVHVSGTDRSNLVDYLSNGLFLEVSSEVAGPFPSGTSHVDTLVVRLFSIDGQRRTELARLPYQTRFAATLPQGGTIHTPLPLEPRAAYAAGRSTVYVGYGSEWRIRRFTSAGEELPEIVLQQPRQLLTTEAREAWKAPLIDRMPPEQRPDMVRYLAALPYSDSLPAYDSFLVDDTDQLWVREFPVPGADTVVWRVFGADGTLRARAVLGPQQRLFHVGRDFAVIWDTRADGVEVVMVRAIHK